MVLAGHMNLYPEWKKLRRGLVRPEFYNKIDMAYFLWIYDNLDDWVIEKFERALQKSIGLA